MSITKLIGRLFEIARPYRGRFLFAMGFTLVGSMLWLIVPLGLRELLDAVFEAGDRSLLNWLAFGLISLFLVQVVFGFLGSYWLEWIGEKLITDLRRQLYAHLQRLGLRFSPSNAWVTSPRGSPTTWPLFEPRLPAASSKRSRRLSRSWDRWA